MPIIPRCLVCIWHGICLLRISRELFSAISRRAHLFHWKTEKSTLIVVLPRRIDCFVWKCDKKGSVFPNYVKELG